MIWYEWVTYYAIRIFYVSFTYLLRIFYVSFAYLLRIFFTYLLRIFFTYLLVIRNTVILCTDRINLLLLLLLLMIQWKQQQTTASYCLLIILFHLICTSQKPLIGLGSHKWTALAHMTHPNILALGNSENTLYCHWVPHFSYAIWMGPSFLIAACGCRRFSDNKCIE